MDEKEKNSKQIVLIVSGIILVLAIGVLLGGIYLAKKYDKYIPETLNDIRKTSKTVTEQPVSVSDGSKKINPDDPQWGSYMSIMQKQIKANWNPAISDSSKRVVLKYSINKDGSVSNVTVQQSSNDEAMDQAAIDSLMSTAPFSPLPDSFSGESIDVEFTFDYNVNVRQ